MPSKIQYIYCTSNTHPTFVNSFPWTLRKLRLNLLFSCKRKNKCHITILRISFHKQRKSAEHRIPLKARTILPPQLPICLSRLLNCLQPCPQSSCHQLTPRSRFSDHGEAFAALPSSVSLSLPPSFAQQPKPD